MIYYTTDDIEIHLFETRAADTLFNSKFDVNRVPDKFKWGFSSGVARLSNFLGNISLVTIPQSIIESISFNDVIKSIIINPITSPEQVRAQQALLEKHEEELLQKESYYIDNPSAVYSEPSYIWYRKNERLQGVFVGIPSDFMKGVLSGVSRYSCCSCGETELTDDIPDMYYDNNQNVYCLSCADGKGLKHVGE